MELSVTNISEVKTLRYVDPSVTDTLEAEELVTGYVGPMLVPNAYGHLTWTQGLPTPQRSKNMVLTMWIQGLRTSHRVKGGDFRVTDTSKVKTLGINYGDPKVANTSKG